jgi:hypothetical protein
MVPDAPSPAVGIEAPRVAHGAAAAGSANGNSIFLRSSNLEDQQVTRKIRRNGRLRNGLYNPRCYSCLKQYDRFPKAIMRLRPIWL